MNAVEMKATVIANAFPATSETFVLRHVRALHADVFCEEFRQDLLTNSEGVGHIASPVGRKKRSRSLFSRLHARFTRVLNPDWAFSWRPEMRRLWCDFLDRHKPDVVLAEFAPNALAALPGCLRRGIPLVVHFHGYDASTLMRLGAYRRALAGLFEGAAAVVCVSTRMRQVLLGAGAPPEKLHLIPCGAPVSEFTFSEQTDHQPCVFVAVSRLVPVKGPMVTLKAFHRAHSQRSDIRLVVAGDGPLRAEVARYIRAHALGDAVRLTGSISNDQVRVLMAASSAFVQSSLRDKHGAEEGSPVAVAEALATGLPAIVSRCGGMEDLVKDGYNGFVFDQGDWRTLANRMVQLADDPGLRLRMGRASRRHAENFASSEKNLALLRSVLSGVVCNASRSGSAALGPDHRDEQLTISPDDSSWMPLLGGTHATE